MAIKNKGRLLVGAVIFLLLAVHLPVNVWLGFHPPGSYDGWTARARPDGVVVITGVDANGPARDLRLGDELISINGAPVGPRSPLLNLNRTAPPGTQYTMQVRRDGALREFALRTWVYNRREAPLTRVWWGLVYLLFLLTGAFIFALRRDDRKAWLLALMLWTITGFTGTNVIASLPGWLMTLLDLARLVATFFLPLMLHFFLVFPEPAPWTRRFPRLERWLYLPFLLTAFPVFGLGRFPENVVGPTLYALFHKPWLLTAGRTVAVAYISGALLALAVNYRAADPLARRRLRVIVAGSGMGFFNLLLMPLGDYMGLNALAPRLWDALNTMLLVTIPLIPLSFAYAIIRHKVIPVSLILRRGARYALVSRGSTILSMIVAGLGVTALFTALFSSAGLPAALLSAAIGVAVWVLVRHLIRQYLAPMIDRRFFRQAYDSQRIMSGLANALGGVTSQPQLLELVATQIRSALQTENVTIFLRDAATGDYHSQYSCGHAAAANGHNQMVLSAGSVILKPMLADAQPIELDDREANRAAPDLAALRAINAALLLPLKTRHEMPGVIAVGPRLGDLPFSSEDKQLLQSVAGPAALALENTSLVDRMIADARRREELEAENQARARELEEARQLQLSMLPRAVPQTPRLEIAAYMKTATEVGGDYYDFLPDETGALTIAIGDATGHGLKAGMMVTATKSLFSAMPAQQPLANSLDLFSRALKQMNLRGLFMALTLARIEDARLSLAAGGMPTAFIYRAATGTVEEHLFRTIPLGSLKQYRYTEKTLSFDPGDTLVLLSDGLPEQFNQQHEMLDYAAIRDLIAARAPAATPQELIDAMLALWEQWAAGMPQEDDVTMVVVRRVKCEE
ncbi:MAG: SpoIIE family protein phosphatase [Blastocatellia bacterium]